MMEHTMTVRVILAIWRFLADFYRSPSLIPRPQLRQRKRIGVPKLLLQ